MGRCSFLTKLILKRTILCWQNQDLWEPSSRSKQRQWTFSRRSTASILRINRRFGDSTYITNIYFLFTTVHLFLLLIYIIMFEESWFNEVIYDNQTFQYGIEKSHSLVFIHKICRFSTYALTTSRLNSLSPEYISINLQCQHSYKPF